jgi:hypothetical protein
MNHHMALDLCRQRQDELARLQAQHALRGPGAPRASRRRGLPRWSVSWTRLSPGAVGGRTGATGQPRSSWVIIISAGRPGRTAG